MEWKDIGPILLSSLLSGGTVATLAWAALKYHLGKEFCTKQDLNGMGERVGETEDGLTGLQRSHTDLTVRVSDNTREIRIQWERIAEHVIKPLGTIAEKMEALAIASAKQSGILESVREQLRNDRKG